MKNAEITHASRRIMLAGQCPDVTNLETKMAEARKLMSELAAILTKGEAELEHAIAGLDKDLQEIDKRTQATVAEVEAACDRLEKSVKECRRRLRELALSTSCDVKDNVIQGKTTLVQRKGKVTTHRVIVQRAEGFPTLGSLGKMASQIGTRVHDLDLTSTLSPKVKNISMVTLTLDGQAVSRIERQLSTLGLVHITQGDQVPALRFHDNHGKNLRLSNDDRTAELMNKQFTDGIGMSRDPMMPGMLYEVQINEIDNSYNDTYLGVVTKIPVTFTLPVTFCHPNPAALCVGSDRFLVFGDTKRQDWSVLDKLAVGSKVGLAVDTDRSLHLYVDGKHQGVVAPDIPTPCYFMFDMNSRCTKVTALPVTPVP